MKQPIILIGGGGHCISAIDVIEQLGEFDIIGILDLPEKVGQKVLNYPIIGADEDIQRFIKKSLNFLITVGQIRKVIVRENIYKMVVQLNGNLPVIKSPQAYVSQHAEIGNGTIIMHGSIVNAKARIGTACIINSKALIEHETIVGDFCHISTGSILNGQVEIGRNCFIGSNTVVANNIKICNDVVIAAGSQVLKSIANPGIYIGNPLRKIR